MDAIVVAIFSALAGFLVWIAQRYFERRADERLRKEELYRTLLEASIELITTGDGAPFVIESQRAWLYASDEVLEAINEYGKAYMRYSETSGNDAEAIEARAAVRTTEGTLRLGIRRDLRPGTKISAEWVRTQWEVVGSRAERIRAYLGRGNPSSEEGRGD